MSIVFEKLSKAKGTINPRKLGVNLKKKDAQAYTMLILSLFTISFFGFFALRPTIGTIAGLKRQIEDQRELDQKLSQKINQLVTAQAEYEMVAPFIPKIKTALPNNPEYIQLLTDLEKIRGAEGATISSVTIGDVALEIDKPGLLSINIDAQGEYFPLEELVDKILRNERLMTISALDVNQSSRDQSTGVLGLDSKIQAPYTAPAAQSAEPEK